MARDPFNYHWIEDGKVLAGSIPSAAMDISLLKSLGIKAILSLTRRAIDDCPYVRTALTGSSLKVLHTPIPDCGIPTDAILLQAITFLDDCYKQGQSVYVHCRGGIGRTGLILIGYYVMKRGWTLEDARGLMKKRRNYQGNAHAGAQGSIQRPYIDAFPKRIIPMEKAKGTPKKKNKPASGIRALNKVIKQIGVDFNLDGPAMVKYAREDALLGNDDGNQYGTAYTVDGKLLYALVRELQPENILEIGVFRGGSASHMAAACKKNKRGAIVGVDIWEGAGLNIPKSLNPFFSLVTENVDFYLPTVKDSDLRFDFIFEDGAHSEHQVHNIYGALPGILRVGGFIVSHDTATGVGSYIRNGMRKGGVKLEEVKFYEIPPSPCGFSVYRFMGYEND